MYITSFIFKKTLELKPTAMASSDSLNQEKKPKGKITIVLTICKYYSGLFLIDIAKSVIVLDVKPWDDETDIDAMEKAVRSIEADGLLWGQCKNK